MPHLKYRICLVSGTDRSIAMDVLVGLSLTEAQRLLPAQRAALGGLPGYAVELLPCATFEDIEAEHGHHLDVDFDTGPAPARRAA